MEGGDHTKQTGARARNPNARTGLLRQQKKKQKKMKCSDSGRWLGKTLSTSVGDEWEGGQGRAWKPTERDAHGSDVNANAGDAHLEYRP